MKAKPFILFLLFAGIFSLPLCSKAQDSGSGDVIAIGSIINNPGRFNNEFVKIRGLVTQYTPGVPNQSTAYYLIKDDYGAIIKVNTAQGKPQTNTKYEVTGTVVIDQVNMEAYLIEQSKSELTPIALPPPPPPDTRNNWMTGLIIGGVILLAALLVLYFILQSKSKQAANTPTAPLQDSSAKSDVPSDKTSSDDDFKTIKVSYSAPKTLKFIPGKLEIISGLDKGKEFKMQGLPGPNGSIITIGRDKAAGDSEFSHIQLMEKTVSRRQAELSYRDHKLFIKNLSETNYTQLNGSELQVGESREVLPNAVIKAGEVEFRYIV